MGEEGTDKRREEKASLREKRRERGDRKDEEGTEREMVTSALPRF